MPSVTRFQNGQIVVHNPMGYAQVTVGGSAVGLPGLPDVERVRRVMIRVLGGPINFRDDGVDPTDSEGFTILKDEVFVYDGDFERFRMVKDDVADADVRIIYYGDS